MLGWDSLVSGLLRNIVQSKPKNTRKAKRRRSRKRKGGSTALLAAIDLGTNNCRLLIARAAPDGGFHIVDSFSRIVRLGEGVTASGALSEAAMTRTVAALKICAQHIRQHRVTRIRAIATEAARRSNNAQALVERVKREAGLDLEVISSEEEARLAALGCGPLIGADYDGALIFDIGGGSTEIIWMAREAEGLPRVIAARSVPLGVVVLAEREGTDDFGALCADMLKAFSAVKKDMDAIGAFDLTRHHLLGTSGTVTTLAGIAMGLERYVRSRVDGSWHKRAEIADVVDRLAKMSLEQRAETGCVGTERADLILAGCAIYKAIETLWPCENLRVADRGLREGLLRELEAEAR